MKGIHNQLLKSIFSSLFLLFCSSLLAANPRDTALGDGLFARISTNRGEIVVRLEYERTPLTVCNFVSLAEGSMRAAGGKPFYDGLIFHRVIADFMIQGGDPLGNGSGGPGYSFPDEFHPELRHDSAGILSMANAGPGTNGSQFFITHKATPWLDGKHSVFGKLVQGQNTVNAIRQGDRIESIRIIRNGEAAQAFGSGQDAFDELLRSAQAAAKAEIDAKRRQDLALIAEKYPSMQKSSSGIQYRILQEGTGRKPAAGETVAVRYTGSFLSGEVFDGSDFHGGPIEFQAGSGRVIPGWDEAILEMKQGERRLVILPPELAYGERGAGGVIPPNAFLIFEMELVRIR